MKYLIVLFTGLLFSCGDKNAASVYQFDVTGDSAYETIVVEPNETNPSNKDIFIVNESGKQKICTILSEAKFSETKPAIENVYLEANNIQTHDKGFRVVVRNTDIIPDIKFIDLQYKKEWMVKRFGIINTVSSAHAKPYLCTYEVNRTIESLQYDCDDYQEISMVCLMVNLGVKFDCSKADDHATSSNR